MTPPLWQKARTKEPLVESEEDSEKVGVTLNIQKIKKGDAVVWIVELN